MALTPDDVVRLAGLARIDLTDDETAYLAPQLDAILDAVAAVSGVATDDVPPTSHACLLYTSPSPRDRQKSRMPSSA